jgi:hypothetical protein
MVSNAIENGIEARLPTLIGPAGSYKVEVRGSSSRMMRGKIGEVVVHGKDVRVMPQLLLDDLDIVMKDLVADPDTSEIKSVGSVLFQATASEAAVNDYLKHTRPEGMTVQLLDGDMVVRARPTLLRISASVKLVGRLVASGEKLNLKVERLEVAGINTPSIAVGMVEDRINPVMDLRDTGFSPELTSATIVPGAIRITGAADLAEKGQGKVSAGN